MGWFNLNGSFEDNDDVIDEPVQTEFNDDMIDFDNETECDEED